MARDVISLAMLTMVEIVSEVTAIPTGSIWLDKPKPEFINENTYNVFPSVGIIENGSWPSWNNYGETYLVDSVSGQATQYEPAGQIELKLEIQIYCEYMSQLRNYRALLNNYFQQNSQISLRNDILPSQPVSMNLEYCHKNTDNSYFVLIYELKMCTQDFKESQVYTIDEIIVNTAIAQMANVEELVTNITTTFDEDGLTNVE